MFASVAGFELRYQLRNPVFWVAAVIFFLLAFGATTVDQIQIGSGGNTHKNAPYAIAQMVLILSLFYMFVSTAFVANVIVRDDDSGFGPIVRATRITKSAYLLGRFWGAFVAAAIGFLAIPLGVWIGSHMPWLDAEQVGPNRLVFYLRPYLWLGLPDLLLTSALFFALATVTRSMMATYVGVVAFLILWTVTSIVLDRNPAYELAGAYGDPLGFSAFAYATKYWTAAERNMLSVPLAGILLVNRAIALAIGGGALAIAFALFRFGDKPQRAGRRRQALQQRAELPIATPAIRPLAAPRFDRAAAMAQLRVRTRLEFAQVVRSPAYFVLLALGLFNAMASLIDLGEVFGTPVLPVTRIVIGLIEGTFAIIPIIVAIYYAGELVWRERDRRMHEIIDASAVPDWAFVLPKALAVTLVLFSTLVVGMLGAMLMQLFHGYTHLEFGKYLLWYVLPQTVDFALLAVLAVFVQAISPNKFTGWGVMVLYIIARTTFRNLGLGDNLYNYAGHPEVPMSDMNGLGRFWIGAWWFRFYWTAFAIILLVLAHGLWRRGTETRLAPRLRRLPRRLAGPAGVIGLFAVVAFVASGAWIATNTHVWNDYRTTISDERLKADYEKALLRYENVPQPEVARARVAIRIWPHAPRLDASGMLTLVNHTMRPIDRLHVRLGDRDTRLAMLTVPGATLDRDYPRFQYRIYRLAAPLAPGAAMQITFHTVRGQRGFRNGGDDRRLVDNGTFVNSGEIVPAIGMDRSGLLDDRIRRRKYGLVPELRPAKLEDMSATRFAELRGGWLLTDLTVTTDADQTPIAPGNKVSDTTSGGRRTARFVVDAPILNFYSVQSARYVEKHRMHNGIDLVVYHDPRHGANVDRMLAAFAHGLDLYQTAFGPYQFRQTRIIEFPDYERFAQAFAGTMPYSEGLGFIADLSDPTKIDYVTYVVAHELGHQWWAHQALGADMQGATMLTETLSQYSALMVMEHLYGRDQIRRFLKYELDRYLKGRGGDVVEELPLDRVENQQYIHYRKGSLVMYRLKDELGEARVDAALRRYLDANKFKSAPYPRSVDLIAEFRKGASPAEQALITDLFDRITLYDLKAKAAVVRRLADGRYETALTIEAHKLYADGKGRETEAAMQEETELGLFTAMPGRGSFAAKNVVMLKRVAIHSGVQTIRLVSATAPSFAGVDPYNVRIDRNAEDNVIAVTH